MSSQTLLRTPLFERHRAAGAKLVPFAGWEMPVQYSSIREEHMAVREGCGIFDVSHMGEIETSGPDALALLQRLLSNDLAKIPVGGAQYSVLCREDGGVLDDLFTYRLDPEGGAPHGGAYPEGHRQAGGHRPAGRNGDRFGGHSLRSHPRIGQRRRRVSPGFGRAPLPSGQARYLTVTNAANHQRDLEWFREHASGLDVQVEDCLHDYAMLAVQGPKARGLVGALAEQPLPARMTATRGRLAGIGALICGTGYTGEDGVELLVAPDGAPALWDALVDAGATPAGLAARDTLRLEACFHLYGNDLSLDRNPIEAGLGWCCKEDTGFIGSEAVRAAREREPAHPAEKLVAFALDGPGIARQGNPIVGGGVVSSGTLSPCLDIGIGMAYVPAARTSVGSQLEIDVRGRIRSATVRAKPFVTKRSNDG